MNQRGEETRERIVLAAIECVERSGITRVTVREIAEEAAVNVAAVNYHFGSKDELVRIALDRTLGHFFEDLDAMLSRNYSGPDQALAELMGYLYDGMRRYMGISRAHLEELFLGGDHESPFARRLVSFLDRFRDRLTRLADTPDTEVFTARIEQAVSSLLFRAMMPTLFEPFRRYGSHPERERELWLALLSGTAVPGGDNGEEKG
jgi:AcrR family transcriptional regulator